MPASVKREIDEHFVAKEPIPADQFIPRFLDADSLAKVRDKGDVGVRGFQCPEYDRFNPYLMMSDITVGPPLMFPAHPHCGHEMMLYVIDGEFIHEDFMGWKETFRKGDTHWMTTGRGIIHAQAPGSDPHNRHVQFWINLPQDHKNLSPGNQVLREAKTPQLQVDGAQLRLLVGTYDKQKSPIRTVTPLLMMDVLVEPGRSCILRPPADHFVGAYVLGGEGSIGGVAVEEHSVVRSRPTTEVTAADDSSLLEVAASPAAAPLRFLLFAGRPISEPVAADGFFVCRTPEETRQAVLDFEQCTNSFAAGKNWTSNLA